MARAVVGTVVDLNGGVHEYHIPALNDAHRRNLARNLTDKIAEREGLSDEERKATWVHILRQLNAKAAQAAASSDGWRNGARVRRSA